MNRIFFYRERAIYFCAILTSILLSIWISYHNSVLNPDGICYLLSAQAVGTAGISAATHLCNQAHWPFYSILIYYFSALTHLSVFSAATLLNAFFSLISVVTFIAIVRELGGSKRVLWLAALVILSAHTFNAIRDEIIRDHGFWAFYLVSILMLLQYFRLGNQWYALGWSFSLIVATLFRIEGVFFLLCLPFITWLRFNVPRKQRAKMFFTLNMPTFGILIVLTIWALTHPDQSLLQFGRFSDTIQQYQNAWAIVIYRFHTAQQFLAQQILNNSPHDIGFMLVFAIIASYIFNVLTCLSWIFVLILIYAWHRNVVCFATNAKLVLWAYIGLNIIITVAFFIETFFLSNRYLIALTLVMMLWLPFALNHILKLWPVSQRHKEMITLTMLAMLVTAFTAISNLHSKAYLRTAGNWLAQHVPANSSLYVNDYQVMYYSEHFGNDIFTKYKTYSDLASISHAKWKNYQYLALHLRDSNDASLKPILDEISILPIKIFSNKRGDKIVIYKIS